jgi:hypothetical protein
MSLDFTLPRPRSSGIPFDEPNPLCVGRRLPARTREDGHFMSVSCQCTCQMTPNESSATCYENLHILTMVSCAIRPGFQMLRPFPESVTLMRLSG